MHEDVKDILNDMAHTFELMAKRLRDPSVTIEEIAFVQRSADRLSDALSKLQTVLAIDAI